MLQDLSTGLPSDGEPPLPSSPEYRTHGAVGGGILTQHGGKQNWPHLKVPEKSSQREFSLLDCIHSDTGKPSKETCISGTKHEELIENYEFGDFQKRQ